MPGDVFEEDPFRTAFTDDAGDVRPEVPGIFGAAALSAALNGWQGYPARAVSKAPREGRASKLRRSVRCFTSTAAFKSYVDSLNAPNAGLAAE